MKRRYYIMDTGQEGDYPRVFGAFSTAGAVLYAKAHTLSILGLHTGADFKHDGSWLALQNAVNHARDVYGLDPLIYREKKLT